jgi:hypothetical protein
LPGQVVIEGQFDLLFLHSLLPHLNGLSAGQLGIILQSEIFEAHERSGQRIGSVRGHDFKVLKEGEEVNLHSS